MIVARAAFVASLLLVGAGAAWIHPPLGPLAVGAMLWWDLHDRGSRRS